MNSFQHRNRDTGADNKHIEGGKGEVRWTGRVGPTYTQCYV